MREEYIKKFATPADGHCYVIKDAPFICTVGSTGQNLVCSEDGRLIINNNGVLELSDRQKSYFVLSDGSIVVKNVTSITSSTLTTAQKNTLKRAVIGRKVTSVGGNAFFGCAGLTSITIPNSVTSIGQYAFRNCTGLTSITIPNSVTSIGEDVFSDCTGLTSITISSSVTSIGNNAFYGCTGLTSITIPNSVTSIGSSAFYGCTGLTSITISSSVTSIGSSAFSNVPHIYYSGSATGAPWGALAMN